MRILLLLSAILAALTGAVGGRASVQSAPISAVPTAAVDQGSAVRAVTNPPAAAIYAVEVESPAPIARLSLRPLAPLYATRLRE